MECEFCQVELIEDANYCHKCGGIHPAPSAEDMLGVTITDDDIADYCFKGYIQKTLGIGKAINVTIRTLTQKESSESKLAVDQKLNGLPTTDDTYGTIKNLEDLKYALVEINGAAPSLDALAEGLAGIIIHKIHLLNMAVNFMIQKGQVSDF